jgi:BlaI family transcriptional regulator, penicillinase repressor
MAAKLHSNLSRRERQIMDIIYKRGRATAAEVMTDLPDPPSYSAVRALLRLLEQKGAVTHRQDGARYIYLPTVAREKARLSALKQLVSTFFDGSSEKAVAALLTLSKDGLSDDQLDRIARMIDEARREGR